MAKAAPARRVPVSPTGGGGGTTTERGYLRGVWQELKKVIWPTPGELWRMTGIVLATVLIFAVLIGGADYVLGLGVKQIYSSSSQSSPSPGQKVPIKPGSQPQPPAPSGGAPISP